MTDTVSLKVAADSWFNAFATEKKAFQTLNSALEQELPRACGRVNRRNIVSFSVETIAYCIVVVVEKRVLKISAGQLKSRDDGEDLPEQCFSNEEEHEICALLLPAFIEELGIVGVFEHENFSLSSYYVRW